MARWFRRAQSTQRRRYRTRAWVEFFTPIAAAIALVAIVGGVSWVMYAVFSESAEQQKQQERQFQLEDKLLNERTREFAEQSKAACTTQGGTPFETSFSGKCVLDSVIVDEWDLPDD